MQLLIYIFIAICIVQLVYQLWWLAAFCILRSQEAAPGAWPTLTIVLCAKNEAENLKLNLDSMLGQQYEGVWNVLVVNDASTDATASVLASFAAKNPRLQVLEIAQDAGRTLPGKKHALEYAIRRASADFVLLTDADCHAASPYWASQMVAKAMAEEADAVLGYGAYLPAPGLLNAFVRFETLHTAIQYFSHAIIGKPYMCVGRNVLYKTQPVQAAWQSPQLLAQMQQTASGDDDLMIGYMAGRHRIACQIHHAAITYSRAPATLAEYKQQKQRHTSSAKYYSLFSKATLALYALSQGGFWLLLLYFLAEIIFAPIHTSNSTYYLLGGLLLLRLIGLTINFALYLRALIGSSRQWPIATLDVLWAIYNLLLSPYIFFKNNTRWK